MKKLNNRGFAVTTVLYGIIIMVFLSVFSLMAILATNRTNTHNLADIIEDELIRFGKTSASFDSGVASAQEFIVPDGQSGWYKIELWGASGADVKSTSGNEVAGGNGAYTSGLIHLTAGDRLYFRVGGTPSYNSGSAGSNGGGGIESHSNTTQNYGGGGGATEVRFGSDVEDKVIMIAAGGGGASGYGIGAAGGAGGTLLGFDGSYSDATGSTPADNYTNATGGLQTKGGTAGVKTDGNLITAQNSLGGSFLRGGSITKGTNAKIWGSAGGNGYYGGGAGAYITSRVGSGGGGSSYISGYAGVYSKYMTASQPTLHSSGKYFVNAMMLPAVNDGAGKASIQLVSIMDTLVKTNDKLNNVQYIRDCIAGSNANDYNHWLEFQAISEGKNIAQGKSISAYISDGLNLVNNGYISEGSGDSGAFNGTKDYYAANNGEKCITVNLGGKYNLDEIAAWHYYKDGRSYKNKGMSVSADGINFTPLTEANGIYLIPETVNGIRYSAYQPDSLGGLPEGEYYIKLASSTNKFLTGDGLARFDLFSGDSKQKWTVKREGTGYILVESSSSYILRKDSDSAFANSQYTTGMINYVWNITPAGNGTYYLEQASSYLGSNGKLETIKTGTELLKQQFIFIKI